VCEARCVGRFDVDGCEGPPARPRGRSRSSSPPPRSDGAGDMRLQRRSAHRRVERRFLVRTFLPRGVFRLDFLGRLGVAALVGSFASA